MAPPLDPFPPGDLEHRVQLTPRNKLKKHHVDLRHDCRLQALRSYNCNIDRRRGSATEGRVVCEAVERLFRRCKDGLTVETTAWESRDTASQQTDAETR